MRRTAKDLAVARNSVFPRFISPSDRRSPCRSRWLVLLSVVAGATLWISAQSKATETQHPSYQTGTVVQKGTVEYEVYGEPLTRKDGREIVALAKDKEFEPNGRLVRRFDNGRTIEYVPAQYKGPDPIAEALAEGLLVYKFTVTGKAPSERDFAPGTYYVWLDFVDGHWRATTLNDVGQTMCAVFGVVVRREIYPGARHEHEIRKITTHPTGTTALGATEWILSPAGAWYPIPCCSCTRAVICSPT